MKREAREKRKKRIKIHPLIKLVIFLAAGCAIYFFLSSSIFDVSGFQVEGNNYYTQEEVLVMGNCKTGKNIFWGQNLKDIKGRLEKDAYMQGVTVKRSLPDKIVISLDERRQSAAIVYGEKYVVIDNMGTVLRKTEVEPKITILKGLTISRLTMGQAIEAEERVPLRQTLKLLESASKGDMYFIKIAISDVELKAYVLDNLICKGTADDLINAIESKKLQMVIQELFERDIERGVIKVGSDGFITFTPKLE